MYVTHLGGDLKLFETLVTEFERAVDALLVIRGHRELLDDSPVLQSAIALRNPYVDPLSLLQISLLRRKRKSDRREQKREGEDRRRAGDYSERSRAGIAQHRLTVDLVLGQQLARLFRDGLVALAGDLFQSFDIAQRHLAVAVLDESPAARVRRSPP